MPVRQTIPQGTTPVYDSETVRRALARVAEIEAKETEAALSAAQIEALGRELGLSPDAVRRSLGELDAAHLSTPQHQAVSQASVQTQDKLPIFPKGSEIGAAFMPGMLYGVFMGILFTIEGRQIMVPGLGYPDYPLLPLVRLAIIFYIPMVFAFWNGWQRRDWRLGALSGTAVSLLTLLGIYIGLTVQRAEYSVGMDFSFLAAATALGLLGGLCGRAQRKAKAAQERAANR